MPVPKEPPTDKALKSKIDQARKLIESHAPRDSMFRYHLGAIVAAIKEDAKKYGTQAVERLAHELGYDASTLYEYATVANAWTKAEFTKLAKKKTAKGMPLSFSHFIELAQVNAKKLRVQLTERALKESLSVRDVREVSFHAEATKDPTVPRPTQAPSPSPATDLSDLITTTEDLITKQTTWKTTLAGLHTLNANKKTLVDQIAKAIDRNRDLRNTCDTIGELLEAERQRIEASVA